MRKGKFKKGEEVFPYVHSCFSVLDFRRKCPRELDTVQNKLKPIWRTNDSEINKCLSPYHQISSTNVNFMLRKMRMMAHQECRVRCEC